MSVLALKSYLIVKKAKGRLIRLPKITAMTPAMRLFKKDSLKSARSKKLMKWLRERVPPSVKAT
jgi:hypothetical protein